MISIRKEERYVLLAAAIFFVLINAVTIAWYYDDFTVLTDNYRKLFVGKFHISGFDPLTYQVISEWDTAYNVYRHPLLAFFMWPFYMINQGLVMLTGINCAIFLTALILVFCSCLSALFLFRIFYEIIGVRKTDAWILTGLTYSMAYIMLSAMVPDHFIMSMSALTLTLYISGRKLKDGSALNLRQTIMLFLLTAGISLNNGLKVFLAALFTRRKRFFEWRYLLLAVVVPSAMIWSFARWEYRHYVLPKELARKEIRQKKENAMRTLVRQSIEDTLGTTDRAKVDAEVNRVITERVQAKKQRDSRKIWKRNTGKPFMQGEFMRWTDKTTSRKDVIIECLLGEGIQLHKDHLLGDVLRNRPLIVRYDTTTPFGYVNYAVEALIAILFFIGIWKGRHSLFLWTSLSFLLTDLLLHIGLGFGINEVYIMSAHYLFVLPISMAYLLKESSIRFLSYALLAVTLWCLGWNGALLAGYFVV